jgi:hypothetical protein
MDYFRGAKSVYVALLPIVGGKIEGLAQRL